MGDLQEQLATLRRRIAHIDRKYADAAPASAAAETRPSRYFPEDFLNGEVVETPHGRHFETERLYERHRRHGSMDISNLLELPEDLLGALSEGCAPLSPVSRWAFLDTETTGLAGGSGTCAFLIGVGRITEEGFRVRQFFMRDHGEEASLLCRLSEHLGRLRRADHLQRQDLRSAAARNTLSDGPRQAALRQAGASGSAARRAAALEAAAGELPPGGPRRARSSASSAKATCRAK